MVRNQLQPRATFVSHSHGKSITLRLMGHFRMPGRVGQSEYGMGKLCVQWIMVLGALLLCSSPALAATSLQWNTNRSRITADIKGEALLPVLRQVAAATRWHVFVEPSVSHTVSAKFS